MFQRRRYVKVNGVRSEDKIVRCDVPQASVLGPILFLIYVNDMRRLPLSGKLNLFDDDAAFTLLR